ncbi:MAG: asparagine synthase (glutamine-hydrolyzing) [Bacteroidia bacterium]|nr:asparagine synthase (glutamine-hydrolyzing) [Bacteroidia bacterium]
MCGINGILSFKGSQLDKTSLVKLMNTAIAHRGPDDEGIYTEAAISLGHRRLSIIDTSNAGHQPMSSSDGRYTIVFNGEIYNYIQLKKDLSSYYDFRTLSDTEVILAGFIKYGPNVVKHLQGIFAFAIWDTVEQKLFLTRDHLGVKPVYYSTTNEAFIFSSEIKGILATQLFKPKVDQVSLVDFFRYQRVHAPRTILQNVHVLEPGTYVEIDGKQIKENRYFTLQHTKANSDITRHSAAKEVRSLLEKSMEQQMVADVEVGAFLSGGIDSTVVVGLMSKISSQRINTFSITFSQKDFDESTYSSLVARKFNTNHRAIQLHPHDLLEALPDALKALDHPSADGINTYLISKKTREQGIKVALSGLGGDEIFCGYPVYSAVYKLKQMESFFLLFPSSFYTGLFQGAYQLTSKNYFLKLAESFKGGENYIDNFLLLSRQTYLDHQIEDLLKDVNLKFNSLQGVSSSFRNGNQDNILSLTSYFEMNTYMTDTLLRDADQMSMVHGLEVRVPFLDLNLVSYVMGLPDHVKKGKYAKNLLIESTKDILPEEVYNRSKKGFVFPWKYWMKNELHSFCEERINSFALRAFVKENAIKELWNRFIAEDKSINWSRIWQIVVLEEWLRKNNVSE